MRRRGLWIAGALALSCAGVVGWRAVAKAPIESAHAASLRSMPALIEVPPAERIAAIFADPVEPGSPAYASASPEACGTCHMEEAAAWRASRHAVPSPPVDCAACHLRTGGVLTAPSEVPPKATLDIPPEPSAASGSEHVPDGGPAGSAPPHPLLYESGFRSGALCARCHDRADEGPTVLDKLEHETVAAWTRTAFARDGVGCNDCHMPGGSHSFPALGDPELAREAVLADARFITDGARIVGKLTVTAARVGHRLPDSSQVALALQIDQVDIEDLAIEGTRVAGEIGRRLEGGEELWDTRLFPGESKVLVYERPFHPEAMAMVARVTVKPRREGLPGLTIWETRVPLVE
jgi:hypothetical protein